MVIGAIGKVGNVRVAVGGTCDVVGSENVGRGVRGLAVYGWYKLVLAGLKGKLGLQKSSQLCQIAHQLGPVEIDEVPFGLPQSYIIILLSFPQPSRMVKIAIQ
ncbi:hypothetical protein Tco_0747096 [Tanacetum coccineum]